MSSTPTDRSLGRPGLIKRLLPRTLLGRSLLILITPLVLLQVMATYVFYDRHWDTITRRLANALAGEIGFLVDLNALAPDRFPFNGPTMQALAKRRFDLDLAFDADRVLPNQPPAAPVGFLEAGLSVALSEQLRRPFVLKTREHERFVEIEIQLAKGILHVVARRERLFSVTTTAFILWMIGTSLVLVAIAIVFMRNQVRAIRRLSRAADSFGKGRDVPDYKPEGAIEVRQAGAAFLIMRERLRRQIAQRTEMLAGVSHDLRTPITRMRLQLEMMGDGAEIADLKSDLAEMEAMIDEYLAFARGEGGEVPVTVDLEPLLRDAAEAAGRHGAVVQVTLTPPLVLTARPQAVQRVITNLLANAQRHGGGRVWLSARRRAKAVEILIDDAGPGIPADKRREVFKPFHRLNPRRSGGGGAGLGLTIARDLIRSHGGEVTLEDAPQGGLRVRLILPV